MATVAFKKGLLAALPSTYTEGTFYVTTDERAIYLDVDGSTRIRIGDFQEFATLQALQANTNPSTTALYYITELNVLAKWNGTSYVQINLDTGATSIEVVGDGNTVTAASYDPATRKITLTKGATHTTAEDVSNAIDLAIGELGNKEGDTPYANVKDYVDTKIADVVAGSIEGLGDLASKDEVTEADLEATLAAKINGKADVGTAEDTSSMDTVKGAKKYADEKVAAAVAGLDKTDSAVEHQFVTAVSEADGVITVSRAALAKEDIPAIDQSQVTGLATALAGKQDNVVFNTTYNAESNKAATMADVNNAVADLSGAMHYEGDSSTDPADGDPTVEGHTGAWAKGDVVTYNAKEYVYDGATWRELGDESSFAVKGSIKNADIAADAAIDQSKIGGLTEALAAKATPADISEAIGALDVADAAESGKFVTQVSETDGKIAVVRAALAASDIPALGQDKITGLTDALAAKAAAADVEALEELVGETAVATQITNAIGALDVEDAAVATQLVSAVSEADGKISVTRRALVAADIPEIGQAKVTGLETALGGKQDTLVFNTEYNATSNKAATMSDVTDALTWGTF